MYSRHFKKIRVIVVVVLSLLFCAVPMAAGAVANLNSEQGMFASAASEFNVPESLLLALSYNESRWESYAGQMSVDGGFGLMDLRTYQAAATSGRDGSQVTPAKQSNPYYYTLDQAARLLSESPDTLKNNDQQNIRGAAAVLADDARKINHGQLPGSLSDWYGAVAAYSGSTDSQTAQSFADDVYSTITSGASLTIPGTSQSVSLAPTPDVQPNRASEAALGLQSSTALGKFGKPECPSSLNCRFIPAAYGQNNPNDPTNYGNFDYAHRPIDMPIKYIYIHDTEGSYDSAISEFQNPTSYVSANYVIRSSDGAITQMVPNEDVSWGVGNWYMNMHGINIEHEGQEINGATWYTEAMYRSSATLVRWLADTYHIPLDRQHIIGHEDVPRYPAANQAVQHTDPGPFWDWNHYMDLIRDGDEIDTSDAADGTPAHRTSVGQSVTIAPKFATNQQPIQDCSTQPCKNLPPQGSSIVYLHTQPSNNASLLSDPYLHTDGSPGTTSIVDWSATASAGSQYVVASVQGNWTGVWFGGKVGWFYNPPAAGRTTRSSTSAVITPRPGLNSIAVYPNAFPETTAYPKDVPPENVIPMYTMPAGQRYTTTGQSLPTDYFYDKTINYSAPDDHIIVHGAQKYYQIAFNHHIGFVKADDVVVCGSK